MTVRQPPTTFIVAVFILGMVLIAKAPVSFAGDADIPSGIEIFKPVVDEEGKVMPKGYVDAMDQIDRIQEGQSRTAEASGGTGASQSSAGGPPGATVIHRDVPAGPSPKVEHSSSGIKQYYSDKMHMKNGSSFNTQILGGEFGLFTNYGQIKVPRDFMGSIHFEGENKNIETILTITGDRYSGFLIEPKVRSRDRYGNLLETRKEQISRINFKALQSAGALTPAPDQVFMRNTDVYHAEIVTDEFILEASYGSDMKFPRREIDSIEFEGDDRVIGKIVLREGQGVHQGTLKNEEIEVRMPFGQVVAIYKDKFQKIDFGAMVADPSAGQTAAVRPQGHEVTFDAEKVAGKYILLIRKSPRSGTVAESLAVWVNGTQQGEYVGDRKVDISDYLMKGNNRIEFLVKPLAGYSGSAHLAVKIGGLEGKVFRPQLYFNTGELETAASGRVALSYFIDEQGQDGMKDELALFVTPAYPARSNPLAARIYLDGELLAHTAGTIYGLRIPDPGGTPTHKFEIVTTAVEGITAENWLKIEVGRVAEIKDGAIQFESLLSAETKTGWRFTASGPVSKETGRDEVVISLPLSL